MTTADNDKDAQKHKQANVCKTDPQSSHPSLQHNPDSDGNTPRRPPLLTSTSSEAVRSRSTRHGHSKAPWQEILGPRSYPASMRHKRDAVAHLAART